MSSDHDPNPEDAAVDAVLRGAAGLLLLAMRRSGVDRAELARRLGTTPGFVSHLLTGRRNMTLRTLASVLATLGFELELRLRRRPSPSPNAFAGCCTSPASSCDTGAAPV